MLGSRCLSVRIHANTCSVAVKRNLVGGLVGPVFVRYSGVILTFGLPEVEDRQTPACPFLVCLGDIPPQAPSDDRHQQPWHIGDAVGDRVLGRGEERQSGTLGDSEQSPSSRISVQGVKTGRVAKVIRLHSEKRRFCGPSTSPDSFLVSKSP